MTGLGETNRRTVLKTIGLGVVGGTVLTGPAVASHGCGDDLCIHLNHFSFVELDTSITVTDGDSKLVTFTNVEDPEFDNAPAPKHDVNIHEEGATDEVNSAVLSGGDPGDSYQVRLENPGGGNLNVIETNANGNSGGTTETITASFSGGSIDLHVHCRHHQGMEGTIIVNRTL